MTNFFRQTKTCAGMYWKQWNQYMMSDSVVSAVSASWLRHLSRLLSWVPVFCQSRGFVTYSLKKSFVAYEFAWEQILNKCTVISTFKQNNDQKMSDCLSLTRSFFVLLTALKQFIYLKWPMNIINQVSHSNLSISPRINHDWFFLFFVYGDRHICPHVI